MKKICLIVDDSKMVRRVSARILEELNFVVEQAENGHEALDFCHRDMPDLILLDWYMPSMDGLTFIKQLRSGPGGDQPIIIFCSSERSVEKILEALDAGADEYIMKPFDSEIISSKLYQVGLVAA